MAFFSFKRHRLVLLGIVYITLSETAGAMKNVLFIVSDDMRPELGTYMGPYYPSEVHPDMQTPCLDALARKSLLLERAYVQQAVCSPSRTSFLTSRRPDTTHVHDLVSYFRETSGNFTTLPQYFKNHGYTTVGMGKVFHPGIASGNNDPISWTEPYIEVGEYWERQTDALWEAIPDELLKKHPLHDMLLTQKASETLAALKTSTELGKPFFLAVGFKRPHLPFVVPQSFLDKYPVMSVKLPANPYAPLNMPKVAWSGYDEIWKFSDVNFTDSLGNFNTTLPDKLSLELRRAYYAAVSYIDSLVGEVLQTLQDLGLANSTIVAFLGDHGWQLGEHAEWCKHTNFELATHAPVMIHIPGITDHGIRTPQLTEFVDIYPTLVEAAGLPQLPLCSNSTSVETETCTEGVSLMPLVKDPERPWKRAIFSQYPRMDVAGNTIMGYSMRTDRYRYTEWVKYRGHPHYQPLWTHVFKGPSIELYDHQADPNENINIALSPHNQKLVKRLSQMLHQGWRKQVPKD